MSLWNAKKGFQEWKRLLSGSIENFRRPHMLFDFNGRFVTRCAYFTNKVQTTFDNFTSSKKTDMLEYAFFSVGALKKLLLKSETVSVVFLDNPIMKVGSSYNGFLDTSNMGPTEYSSRNANDIMFRMNLKKELHPFWKFKAACRESKCEGI